MKKSVVSVILILGCVFLLIAGCKMGDMGPAGPQGPQGPKGEPGSNGIAIMWKGESPNPPSDAQLNWAYFNTVDGNAYIFDGTHWQLLAQHGADGKAGDDSDNSVAIVWRGEAAGHPENPQLNWVYYNNVDKGTYIYDGTTWHVLVKDGVIGPQGPKGDD